MNIKMEDIQLCLNTRGCYYNQTKYIKIINSSNFCSYDLCYLLYTGRKKRPIPIREIYNDPERQQLHDLFRWALGAEKPDWVKQKESRPKLQEWIVTFPDCEKYLWDDFAKRFVKHIPGVGIFDDLGKLIADKNSEYYNQVIYRINEVQHNPELVNKNVIAPQMKRGVKPGTKRGPYKEREKETTFICKGCGRTIQIASRRKKQFCSESCRRRFWRRKKQEKLFQEKLKGRY